MQLSVLESNTPQAIEPKAQQVFKPRPYQVQAVSDTRALLPKSRSILLVLSTGAGKTVIALDFISKALAKGKKILFCVDRDPLVNQSYQKFRTVCDRVGVIKAKWPEDRNADIYVGSLQTMARRSWWKQIPFDLVILDEAHETAFSQAAQQIRDAMGALEKVIPDYHGMWEVGLTATPWRLSKKQSMGDHYDSLVVGPSIKSLIKQGYLAQPKYYSIPAPDLSGVRTVRGDYSEGDLSVVCNNEEVIKKTVSEWFRLTPQKKTIVFCVNVEHAKAVAKEFKKNGVPSDVVHGETDGKTRKRLYADLANGDLLVLTCCNVLSTGFDEPTVEVVWMLRPTKSRSLYFQQGGRGGRIAENKLTGLDDPKYGFTIVDQAGNVYTHGFIEELEESDISLEKGSTSELAGEAIMKVCPPEEPDKHGKHGCSRYLYAFQMKCPDCGYEFESVKEKIIPLADLEEVIPEVPTGQRRVFIALIRDCYNSGKSPGVASYHFKLKYGYYPKKGHVRNAVFEQVTPRNITAYSDYLIRIAGNQGRSKAWVRRNLTSEFGDAWKPLEPSLFEKQGKLIAS